MTTDTLFAAHDAVATTALVTLDLSRRDVLRALRRMNSESALSESKLCALRCVLGDEIIRALPAHHARGAALRLVLLETLARMKAVPHIRHVAMSRQRYCLLIEHSFVMRVPAMQSCRELCISKTTYYRLLSNAVDLFCDELARYEAEAWRRAAA